MASKYIDTTAILNVLGCLYTEPTLFDQTETYHFSEDDFVEDFHKIIYGSLYTLYTSGISTITLNAINDFLENHPQQKAVYDVNRGNEYLTRISSVPRSTFDYYYKRMKKMTLLRVYDNIGVDVSFLYDPDNILDSKKKEAQEEWLDNVSLQDIANKVDERIEQIKLNYVENDNGQAYLAGDGIFDMLARYEKAPDVGVNLYGKYINTITRGARLGKFYLRSAPTGIGKTRSMIADACHIACAEEWDEEYGCWVPHPKTYPTLFIGTEQDKEEIQTMMLAFISNVNEEHILTNRYEKDERDKVYKAAEILQKSPLYIEELPEFNLQDVENVIKRNLREHDIMYVFHDYIHTSLKILEEISRRAGKITLREDNILFMLSARLKEICVQYNVFLMSATQLNGDYQDSKTPDQNLLRGAKAIADKIDYGSILLPVKDTDLAALETLLTRLHCETPTIKLSIYKNRRGRYKSVILWCKANLGTCRIDPMFMTDFQYEQIGIEDLKIFIEEEGAF